DEIKVTTNEQGHFELHNLEPGAYLVWSNAVIFTKPGTAPGAGHTRSYLGSYGNFALTAGGSPQTLRVKAKPNHHLELGQRKVKTSSPATSGSSTSMKGVGKDTLADKISVDPLLRKAVAAYNETHTPRKDAIQLFKKYIKQTPKSPFIAECYFRIG